MYQKCIFFLMSTNPLPSCDITKSTMFIWQEHKLNITLKHIFEKAQFQYDNLVGKSIKKKSDFWGVIFIWSTIA